MDFIREARESRERVLNGIVVVDASLAFKWLVRDDNSDQAQAISRSWANAGVQTAAPHLLPVEVANALHRRVLLGELTVENAVRLQHLLASGIELREDPQPSREGDADRRSTPPGGGL